MCFDAYLGMQVCLHGVLSTLMLVLLFEHVSVPAGVLSALLCSEAGGHVSVPALGAECIAVL